MTESDLANLAAGGSSAMQAVDVQVIECLESKTKRLLMLPQCCAIGCTHNAALTTPKATVELNELGQHHRDTVRARRSGENPTTGTRISIGDGRVKQAPKPKGLIASSKKGGARGRTKNVVRDLLGVSDDIPIHPASL